MDIKEKLKYKLKIC